MKVTLGLSEDACLRFYVQKYVAIRESDLIKMGGSGILEQEGLNGAGAGKAR